VSCRFSVGIATVVMLVILRVNIGWHFFSEGVKHYADPHWTSEPVLRAAKGPLAPFFHSYLPDFHGFDDLLHGKQTQSPEHAVKSLADAIEADWKTYSDQFAAHYGLNEAQQRQVSQAVARYRGRLHDWSSANADALATHVHEWQRNLTAAQTPASDLPFRKQRFLQKQAALNGEASGLMAELKGLERDYDASLEELLTDDQRARPPLAHHVTSIDLVDDVMTYAILGIGLLLLVGLFTRLACLAGAAFLFSVVMMQPFWVSETAPTFNQWVEMFALITLATTQVGRWAGLDFFLAQLFDRSSSKGKSDAPTS
jgi:uncharacterized membrane protein YphA (DoxX/SURF4 family)